MSRTELGSTPYAFLVLPLLRTHSLSAPLSSPAVYMWLPILRNLALDSSLASLFFQTYANHLGFSWCSPRWPSRWLSSSVNFLYTIWHPGSEQKKRPLLCSWSLDIALWIRASLTERKSTSTKDLLDLEALWWSLGRENKVNDTYWNHLLYLPRVSFESHLLSKRRQLCLEQDIRKLLHTSFAERTSFRSLQYRCIIDFIRQLGDRILSKYPVARIFSVLWLRKVILCDSKTNLFPNISYGHSDVRIWFQLNVATASILLWPWICAS